MKHLFIALLSTYIVGACTSTSSGPAPDSSSSAGKEILDRTKATKLLNTFDEEACNVYQIEAGENAPSATLSKSVDPADKAEGEGSFSLKYQFSGKTLSQAPEYVLLEEVWADYRPDLSFHPLGISLWIKGENGNTDCLRIQLIQDKTLTAPRNQRTLFAYTHPTPLNNTEWQRLVIPYSAFRLYKNTQGEETLELARVTGYRIEIVNTSGKAHTGNVKIDALEQLTSYQPEYTPARFSSLFIQLNSVYEGENWDAAFKACKEADINTWIIQYSQGFGYENEVSWYSGTQAPWNKTQYSLIDSMVTAAERQDFKLIFGLFGGDYTGDKNDAALYEDLYRKNQWVIDEIYEKFASSPCFAGWYITEEFHDGSYPDGCWQNNPARDLLADYLQKVAAYCKTKSPKYPVQIAPALFRGKPADLCGEWFKAIFRKTPDIDVLYLQDIGGRCLVDIDVDLPNYFAQIKKACDETGVEFGVDIESFKNCWCPDVPYRAKSWDELQEQLEVAGMFTQHITNFSWATFRPGTGAFDEYKSYLKNKQQK
ncbi:DUF4434 domain-containing protein [Parabacteroides pacaensis]|uniref:DUF4434 domain-containing protein n=1 Tax=Parabacteroides pacaensis TaxID=2086575 RepID=UPI000D112CC0|nr:DUF4434 domain-containing protein [Parabacteroides pacaensis]